MRQMRAIIAVMLAAIWLHLGGDAGAAPIVIGADADTMVRIDLDDRANDNYGLERTIMVGNSRGGGGIPYGGPDAIRSLIHFNLGGLSGTQIQNATLQLTVLSYFISPPSAKFKVSVHRALGPWIEGNGCEYPIMPPGAVNVDDAFGAAWSAIDPNNQAQPGFDPLVIASQTVQQSTHGVGAVVQFDITPLVRDWLDGTYANHGLVLRDPTDTPGVHQELYFGSRDGLAYNIPGAVEGPVLLITPASASGVPLPPLMLPALVLALGLLARRKM